MRRAAYKSCNTAQELNNLTREERLTRCGYLNYHWSQSGVCASTQHGFRDNFIHTRQSTFRDKKELENVLTVEQVDTMRETFVPELQKTNVVSDLYREIDEENM